MKLVIQRVKRAKVEVERKVVGKINHGFLILLGVTHTDTQEEVDYLVKKVCQLRIFEDQNQKMNLNVQQVEGSILVVSQFTLYANCKDGNRPSFVEAAAPDQAEKLYESFCQKCRENDIPTEQGEFGADMQVELVNDGPVTIVLERNHHE